MKKCCKCKIEKEFFNFYKNKSKKDGFNTTCISCSKEYKINNKEKISINKKYWVEKNKEHVLNKKREWFQKNKEEIKIKRRIYQSNRRKSDNIYKLSCNIRVRIKNSLKWNNNRNTNSTIKILGCSIKELKKHLEYQFQTWMTWDNYGLYNGQLDYGWDIDHIIPCSSALNENDLLKLNHYTNLQPLCSKINREIKRNNITY